MMAITYKPADLGFSTVRVRTFHSTPNLRILELASFPFDGALLTQTQLLATELPCYIDQSLSLITKAWHARIWESNLDPETLSKVRDIANCARTIRIIKTNVLNSIGESLKESKELNIDMNPKILKLNDEIAKLDPTYSKINNLLKERFGSAFREIAEAA